MRILHLITTLDVGGAEMHVLAQTRGQTSRGHEVRVLYLKGAGTLTEDFRAAGASSVRRVAAGPLFLPRAWSDLRWAQIVHTHLLKADMLGAVAATLAGRRSGLFASKHNDEAALLRRSFGLVHGVVGRLPRRTIVLSDHVGRFIAEHGGVPRERQTRIYYGLDPTPFEAHGGTGGTGATGATGALGARGTEERARVRGEFGLGADDVVFVCVARFAAQKAHGDLLAGFAAALAGRRADDPPLALLLVGDDPFGDGRREAERRAAELGLMERVRFTGVRRDVPRLVGASDVFVMTSLWEGLGLVFLEAMAASRPVLATRVSAVPEVVVDGETGILVPPREKEPLARAMLALARDPALRARLGRAGHARVIEHFGLARMIEETLSVYARGTAGPA